MKKCDFIEGKTKPGPITFQNELFFEKEQAFGSDFFRQGQGLQKVKSLAGIDASIKSGFRRVGGVYRGMAKTVFQHVFGDNFDFWALKVKFKLFSCIDCMALGLQNIKERPRIGEFIL